VWLVGDRVSVLRAGPAPSHPRAGAHGAQQAGISRSVTAGAFDRAQGRAGLIGRIVERVLGGRGLHYDHRNAVGMSSAGVVEQDQGQSEPIEALLLSREGGSSAWDDA
jgi:hypothetical protein